MALNSNYTNHMK